MFKKDMTDTSTTHIGSDYISKKDSPKDTITAKPLEYQTTCKTTREILGYRVLVKMYPPVWMNSMWN